jgi:putative ABC transport system permease protein
VATATVEADYFRTMGIVLVRGRPPERGEHNVAIVNQPLLDRLGADQRLLGESLFGFGQVVGVAANSKYWSLTEAPRPFVYRISETFDVPAVCVAIRTRGPAEALAERVNRAIQRVNPDLPAIAARTGRDRLRMWLEPQRAAAMLLGVLGFAALGLAIAGLYGLIAQLLAQRTPEIAVRVALGSSRWSVVWLLLRQSAVLLAAGAALGMAATLVVSRALAAGIGAIGALDAVTMLAVVTLLAAVGAAATVFPASRALRIDPASALKSE